MQVRLRLCRTLRDKQLGYSNIVWDTGLNRKGIEEDSTRFTLQRQ